MNFEERNIKAFVSIEQIFDSMKNFYKIWFQEHIVVYLMRALIQVSVKSCCLLNERSESLHGLKLQEDVENIKVL